VRDTKTIKIVPNEHKKYQMVIKYPKCPLNIPKASKIHQHFPIQSHTKFAQIGIFGSKLNHLATPFLRLSTDFWCQSFGREVGFPEPKVCHLATAHAKGHSLRQLGPGLPDGLFSCQKSQFG
jgi:hypothetical protein